MYSLDVTESEISFNLFFPPSLQKRFNPIYPNATPCDSKKNIAVTVMRAVATEMGQYTLPYCIQLYKI